MENSDYKSLKLHDMAFELARQVQKLTKQFPPEERYFLTSQIRRSSRFTSANISEAYREKKNHSLFAQKLSEANGESCQTINLLDLSRQREYISASEHKALYHTYETISKALSRMIDSPEKFMRRFNK